MPLRSRLLSFWRTLTGGARLDAELDDELELEQELPPQDFGRIAAQTAKQVILQKVRDAEREGIYSEFAGKEGQILRGVVHRIEKRNVILEIGKAEAILPEREQIPGERYNPGDRIRAFVLEVRRSCDDLMLIEAVLASGDCVLAGALDRPGSASIGQDAGAPLGRATGASTFRGTMGPRQRRPSA